MFKKKMALYLKEDQKFTFEVGVRRVTACDLDIVVKWWKEPYLKLQGKLSHQMWMHVDMQQCHEDSDGTAFCIQVFLADKIAH